MDSEDSKNLLHLLQRYNKENFSPCDIGMEDYFFLFKMFCKKHNDSDCFIKNVFFGLKVLFLDSIYNEGKIEKLYLSMLPWVNELSKFENIFTVNYDTNLDSLVKNQTLLQNKKVYHLHGSFNTLDNTYIPESVIGYLAEKEITVKNKPKHNEVKKHLYCNAIMGPTGDYKIDIINKNIVIDKLGKEILNKQNLISYNYPIHELQSIVGTLHIIGLSPNNDSHIIELIKNNRNIKKIVYYFHSKIELKEAKKNFKPVSIKGKNVIKYWRSLK